jgi:hypothetical protein
VSRQKVLVDIEIVCDPPQVWHWRDSLEERAKDMERWAKEFNIFIRDHRSQDEVRMEVRRVFEDQCSFCHSRWEQDENGPMCCNAAQVAWDAQKKSA